MNPNISFPPSAPVLKLSRPSAEKWAATLAEERRRLEEDQDALRERESNLREYEARLRALQADIEAGRAVITPGPASGRGAAPAVTRPSIPIPALVEDAALQAAWEKLHRAREILEAEQNHLRDDRIALRELDLAVKRREEAVAEREAFLLEREALIMAALPEGATQVPAESTMSRLTTAPFKMACAVLRGGRK